MNIKSGAKKSNRLFILFICMGAVLMIAGAVAGYYTQDNDLGGRIFGFGAGFGSAVVAVGSVSLILARRKPNAERQREIDEKDERNIKIRERSAYGTYFVTMFSLSIATFVFVCLGSWLACLIALGLLFIHCISYLMFIYLNGKKL
jgi:uncharacterized membrane protein